MPKPPWTSLLFALIFFQTLAAQNVDYVIHISVDGLHSGQLENLLRTQPDRYVNFQRFVTEGATTFNARIDSFSTVTLPNHTSMITGRPVRQPADDPTVHHGYLDNVQPRVTDTLHNSGNPAVSYIASTFDVAHDRGLSTALYTGKDKFVIYERSYNVTDSTSGGRPDQYLADGDHGVNKIDKYDFQLVNGTSSGLMSTLLADFQTDPFDYSFVHFLEPDSAGHTFGWRSEEWNSSVHSVDLYLGQLFQMVETHPEMSGRTAMILTSDHGGSLLTHGAGINVFRIPFMVWGPDVEPSADLYSLNTLTRQDPGHVQPAYTDSVQPIRNGDSGNLAMSLLGLPPIEGSSINSRHDLRVDAPKVATWYGASAQHGLPGDGLTWTDPRNWQRVSEHDRAPIAGDFAVLTAADQAALIDLQGPRQAQSLRVDGNYQLYNGELQLVTGEVAVAANQHLVIAGSLYSPLGIIKQGPGTLTVDSIVASDLLISAGQLVGPAVIDGDVANRGVMAPGEPTSVQHIQGLLTQGTPGIVRLTLGDGGASSQLVVDGSAVYRGTLDLQTAGQNLDPAEPGGFTRWTLVTSARRFGSFTHVDYNGQRVTFDQTSPNLSTVHVGEGLFRRIEYTNTSVHWVNYRAMPGDVNGDGTFNSADLVAVFSIGGYENGIPLDATWMSGDWNGDQDFTSNDLVAAFASGQFEQPSVLGAVAAVPEPSSAMQALLLAACLAPLFSRRRGRTSDASHSR